MYTLGILIAVMTESAPYHLTRVQPPESTDSRHIISLIISAFWSDEMRTLWAQKIRAELLAGRPSQELTDFIKILDRVLAFPNTRFEEAFTFASANYRTIAKAYPDFYTVSRVALSELLPKIETKHPELDGRSIRALLAAPPIELRSSDESRAKYLAGYREKIFAGNTVRGYLEGANLGVDVYVRIGSAHVVPIYNFLRGTCDRSGGSDIEIAIDTDAVFKDVPSHVANRLRNDWKAIPVFVP